MADVDLTELATIFQDTLTRIDNLVFTTGEPSDELGTISSMAIDVDAKVLYGPKTVAGWGPGKLLTGADGRDPEFRTSGGYLQVRLIGDTDWQNLIPVADLPEGPPGPTPIISIGTVETAPSGDPAGASFGGTAEEPVLNLILPRGGKGDGGNAAWSPVIANVVDGARRVLQITDWTGGGGTKPATGFIGATGLVATAALATDIRGGGGAGSGDMTAANNLSELTDVGAARTKLSVYSKGEADTAMGSKADLVGGKIPVAQIPAVALVDTFTVASQAAMLALTAQPGDVAIRSDLSKSFILQAEPASTLGNWKELLTPTVVVPVKSSAGQMQAGTNATDFATAKDAADAQTPATVTPATAAAGLNFSNFNNAEITLTAALTVGAPSGGYPGKTGMLDLIQNATGGWNPAWHSNYILPPGFGVQSTANGRTCVPYRCEAGGKVRLYSPSKWTS